MNKREKVLFVSFGNRDDKIFDFDTVFFDGINFVERNHIRFMNAANDVRRNLPFKFGEGLKRHNEFINGVNPPVIAHSFDVDYFSQSYFFQPVFGFDEDKIFRRRSLFFR